MSRNRLYVFLSAACAVGFLWLSTVYFHVGGHEGQGVCLFKHVTHIPCPSCGSTRSVLALLHGDVWQALLLNPFGVIIMSVLVIAPLWILADVLGRKSTLFHLYNDAELFVRRRWVAIPLVSMVLMNWIWNIYKDI